MHDFSVGTIVSMQGISMVMVPTAFRLYRLQQQRWNWFKWLWELGKITSTESPTQACQNENTKRSWSFHRSIVSGTERETQLPLPKLVEWLISSFPILKPFFISNFRTENEPSWKQKYFHLLKSVWSSTKSFFQPHFYRECWNFPMFLPAGRRALASSWIPNCSVHSRQHWRWMNTASRALCWNPLALLPRLHHGEAEIRWNSPLLWESAQAMWVILFTRSYGAPRPWMGGSKRVTIIYQPEEEMLAQKWFSHHKTSPMPCAWSKTS